MIGKVHIILVTVLVVFGSNANAQIFDVDNSVDSKYTPPAGSVFDTDLKSSSGGSSYSSYDYKNAILFNASAMLRGAVALEYERGFNKNIVLMGTGGVTLYRDFIKNASLSYFLDETSEDFDITTTKPGIFWGADFKAYFGENFNDDFFTFGIRNFRYNLNYKPAATHNVFNSWNTTSTQNAEAYSQDFKESNLDFYIGYGYTTVFTDNLIGEFSCSIGVRRSKSSSFDLSEISTYSDVQGQSIYAIQLKRTEYTRLTPLFIMSYKIGFAFGD